MKRPLVLIVGAAAAALVIAGIGASAHTLSLGGLVGVHSGTFGDEATAARTESPEPTESPEAAPTAEPTEAPEAPATAEPTEPPESDDQGEHAPTTAAPTGSGEHEGDGGGETGGTGTHHDG